MSDTLLSRRVFVILPWIPLLLVFAYPILCKYDFSNSSLWYYDLFSMNPNIMWFLLLVVVAIALVNWNKKDIGLPSLIAVVLLFSVFEVTTNYPLMARDVYLQGSAVKGILSQGTVANTSNNYPSTHPGFFLLWSIVAQVTGIDILSLNVLLLLPMSILMLIFLMIFVNRRLSVETSYAAVLFAFLLMNFNTNEWTFIHFNTRLFSMLYVLLFLVLFSRLKGRGRSASLFIVFGALVISHVLNALLPVVFLAVYLLFERKRQNVSSSLVIGCGVIYVVWNLYFGYYLLQNGLTTFLNSFYVNRAITTVLEWSPLAAGAKPFFGTLLGTFYKLLLVILALISIYAHVKLRNQTNVRTLGFFLSAVALIYGLSFFSVLRDISINRGILFASIGFASLLMILLTLNQGKSSHFLRRARPIMILFIVALIVPQFVLVHELPVARYERVGTVDSTSTFVMNYRSNQTIVSLGDFPIYYDFYEPFFKGYITLGLEGWNSLGNITSFLLAGPNSSLKVVDSKKIVDWGCILGNSQSYAEAVKQWNKEVFPELDSKLNRVYSNGYDTVFR